MQTAQPNLWGIHAGSTGDADALFLNKNVIAVGWTNMPPFTDIGPNRDAFKAKVTAVYPNDKPGAVRVWAGVMYRFAHEMQPGDLVIYPSKQSRIVHIGRVTGPYQHVPKAPAGYTNQRPVKWLKELPRNVFSQGALFEIGSAITLFLVRNYAEEFQKALADTAPPEPIDEDPTVPLVAVEIAENTQDFILKRLDQHLKGHPFADFVAHLLATMGFRSRVSKPGPDGGIDIIAHRDELGFEPPVVKAQVKAGQGQIGAPDVQALYGSVGHGEFGLFITLGGFSKPAVEFGRSKPNLRLIDGQALVDLILEHYEQLDSRYKAIMPLKRVYVPEQVEG